MVETEKLTKEYENIVSYYDGIAEGYDELHLEEQKEKFRVLRENLSLPENSKVLDVGCGTFFSRKYFPWDMWGIEPSSKMVGLFALENPSLKDRVRVGFAEELVKIYGKKVFDGVICVSVAHHFKNPSVALNQIREVCKPSGKIGISLLKNTNNFSSLKENIYSFFDVLEVIDSSKDVVFICSNK